MQEKPQYFRKLFISRWLPVLYDAWVWVATLSRTKNLREKIIEYVPSGAQHIIDLATGTGETALTLQRAFPSARIYASDLSEGMLKVASAKAKVQRFQITFSLQDAVHTSYHAESADFVCMTFALHDLPSVQRKEVIREAYRLLKSGGVCAIYDYHLPQNWIVRIPLMIQFLLVENADATEFLREKLEEEFQDAGFMRIRKDIYYAGLAQIVCGTK